MREWITFENFIKYSERSLQKLKKHTSINYINIRRLFNVITDYYIVAYFPNTFDKIFCLVLFYNRYIVDIF